MRIGGKITTEYDAQETGNMKLPEGEYPIATFRQKLEDREGWRYLFGRDAPENCPPGYEIDKQFDNPEEELKFEAAQIEKEHEWASDEKLLEHPSGMFIGRGRNYRWTQEIKRRRLV